MHTCISERSNTQREIYTKQLVCTSSCTELPKSLQRSQLPQGRGQFPRDSGAQPHGQGHAARSGWLSFTALQPPAHSSVLSNTFSASLNCLLLYFFLWKKKNRHKLIYFWHNLLIKLQTHAKVCEIGQCIPVRPFLSCAIASSWLIMFYSCI